MAIREAERTSSPQPPHLKELREDSVPNEIAAGVKEEEAVSADAAGGSRRGGVAQEQAARLPRAQLRARRHTAAAADIAYTKACSRVPG